MADCPTVVDEPENYGPTVDIKSLGAFHHRHLFHHVHSKKRGPYTMSRHPRRGGVRKRILGVLALATPESLARFCKHLNIWLTSTFIRHVDFL